MSEQLSNFIDPSARVALAAFLHDLGKFAQRAKIDVSDELLENNKQLYCPFHQEGGWFSHVHAAYTGIAMDEIEQFLPPLKGRDLVPFSDWGAKDSDDSLINAAAQHHKPDTFLQWIVATADRVASGFERNEFEQYNRAKDETPAGKNHYQARQLTLFEQIRLADKTRKQDYKYRYKLRPLCPSALMPVLAEDYEPKDNAEAQKEYRQLWDGFIEDIEKIPSSHKDNLSLWLDHFESLWAVYTHAIPSATAFNIRPDVSLYDHSRATAALAVALWRYHHERKDNPKEVVQQIKNRDDWDEKKLLLVQGDFFGIQDFIFATGGETQKRAAKLLRGRSFYVSLLTECAALKVLDCLGLPTTSQITNAAGKFLIVAPNTEAVRNALKQAQTEMDKWFRIHTYGTAGIGLATLPACCNDFQKRGNAQEKPFQNLMKELFGQLEETKLQRFDLCNQSPDNAVFSKFLDEFNELGVCPIDGRSPAQENGMSNLAYDQIKTGEYLTKYERFLITKSNLGHNTLKLPIFGYYVSFSENENITGKFGRLAAEGKLLRAFDFSMPLSDDAPLWNGYARRHINGYVPKNETGEIKEFDVLAGEDEGEQALMVIKGDIDNLGLIFQEGLDGARQSDDSGPKEGLTFAKMAGLSRQIDAFFTMFLPYWCDKHYRNTYTVFAGGDDFFLIGPWHSQLRLAEDMQKQFEKYVTYNPELHFSAGLHMVKSGGPILYLAKQSEKALEEAKRPPKNAVSCYGERVDWSDFKKLMAKAKELAELAEEMKLSTGYLYSLLQFVDMEAKTSDKPENALWRSWFAYRTKRMLDRRRGLNSDEKQRLHNELAKQIVNEGIDKYKQAYKIALFICLYKRRNKPHNKHREEDRDYE